MSQMAMNRDSSNPHLREVLVPIGTSFAAAMRRLLPARIRPIGYLTDLVRRRTQQSVRLGPFAGMHYVDSAIGSAYLPKLLGTYERELTDVIEQVCASRPELAVILGAAEGYYAVGLALRNPQARVVAFERLAGGRTALWKMASLNGVLNRIDIRGACDAAGLQAVLNSSGKEREGVEPREEDEDENERGKKVNVGSPFVLCDVEGEEATLVDPQIVPNLRSACILVETHEFLKPGITDTLVRRFSPTHSIERIWQTPRGRGEFPFRSLGTALLPSSYLDWALSEWRPERMCWLWMKPRH